jgi:hypothetical protein
MKSSSFPLAPRMFARLGLAICILSAAWVNGASAATAVYSESFTEGQTASAQASQDWVNFRASLTPSAYDTVTISGTFDPAGRTLADAMVVPQIATALKNGTAGSFTAGGFTWNVGIGCGGNMIESPPTELNANSAGDAGTCSCPDPGYIVRPNIGDGNSNWGGANTATCGGPSQTLTVTFCSSKVALVVGAEDPGYVSDVQAKLMATGRFSQVDFIDAGSGTPTLAQLQNYGSVLVWSDGGFADRTTLGNNLADYVDGGGGVVVAVFANASVPIGGRFASSDYYALEPLDQDEGTELTLGTVYEPSSPLMAGVMTFDGGTNSYHGTGSPNGSAVRVADWSNGIPLILRRTIGGVPRVDLNFFPPSSDARGDFWVDSTDGVKLMANALVFTGACGSSKPTPTISTVASPNTTHLGATVTDTATLSAGSNPTGTVTFRLFGPNDSTCGGAPVFTSTNALSGGSATSDPFVPTTPGTYRWVASYSGDGNNNPVAGMCNDTGESVLVLPAGTSVTGTGTINSPFGGSGIFIVNAQVTAGRRGSRVSGNIDDNDPNAGFRMTQMKITGMTFNGDCVHITGTAKIGRTRVFFTVDACDIAPPGTDSFAISISNGYSASGNVTSGQITFH